MTALTGIFIYVSVIAGFSVAFNGFAYILDQIGKASKSTTK